MKKLLGAVAIGALMCIGGALAQVGPFGVQLTTPVLVPGTITFNGGPQSSVIRATGGTFTCTSSGTIVVPSTAITANSLIPFSMGTKGGTATSAPFISTITAGTSFTVTCPANETSIFNYWILG